MDPIILAITGATGSLLAKRFIEKSVTPVVLLYSEWGKRVYEHELTDFTDLTQKAIQVFSNDDLFSPWSSGSVSSQGMVILPCTMSTMGEIASGIGKTLITRSAHCHLKEKRLLILCIRETPLTAINLTNAVRLAEAGATIMPISPPLYMQHNKQPEHITLLDVLDWYVERVLSLFGQKPTKTWEDVR